MHAAASAGLAVYLVRPLSVALTLCAVQVNRGSSNLPRGAYGGGIAFGWGARYALPKPVDAKGFKFPTSNDAFLTLALNGSDVVSGGLRVVVKFMLDANCRYYNGDSSHSDPRRPWAT